MNKFTKDVLEFHKKFEVPFKREVGYPGRDRAMLRMKLIYEESQELIGAMHDCNVVETADGIIDLLYVTIGTALEFGMGDKLDKLWDEVHRSNMSKLHNGRPLKRADGKVLKGKNWTRPDLKSILELQ
jgi:predicted HAD superfamily Cof-like phosphohydrolase